MKKSLKFCSCVLAALLGFSLAAINSARADEPSVVSITPAQSTTARCQGRILNANYLLVSAICVDGIIPSSIVARAGSGSSEQIVRVQEILLHPNYDSRTGQNDLAILHLIGQLSFNEFVQPVTCVEDEQHLDWILSTIGYEHGELLSCTGSSSSSVGPICP